MYWNYRVIKKSCKMKNLPKREYYEIHEVHYDKNGKIETWSKNPMKPYGDTPEELKKDLELMMEAFKKPVLEMKEGKLVEISKK